MKTELKTKTKNTIFNNKIVFFKSIFNKQEKTTFDNLKSQIMSLNKKNLCLEEETEKILAEDIKLIRNKINHSKLHETIKNNFNAMVTVIEDEKSKIIKAHKEYITFLKQQNIQQHS